MVLGSFQSFLHPLVVVLSALEQSIRMRGAFRNGNWALIGAGASAMGAAFLYAQSEREARLRARLSDEFDGMLAAARVKAREETAAREREMKNEPALWTGVLVQADTRLRGHKMFQGKVGQPVDVVEEAVGDGGKYLTVRDEGGRVGLYLTEWVRRE